MTVLMTKDAPRRSATRRDCLRHRERQPPIAGSALSQPREGAGAGGTSIGIVIRGVDVLGSSTAFQMSEGGAQVVDLFGCRLLKEAEKGIAPFGAGELTEGVVQCLRGECLPGGGHCVAPNPPFREPGEKFLADHPVQDGHQGRIADAALQADGVVDLTPGLAVWLRRGAGPEMLHHGTLEDAEAVARGSWHIGSSL